MSKQGEQSKTRGGESWDTSPEALAEHHDGIESGLNRWAERYDEAAQRWNETKAFWYRASGWCDEIFNSQAQARRLSAAMTRDWDEAVQPVAEMMTRHEEAMRLLARLAATRDDEQDKWSEAIMQRLEDPLIQVAEIVASRHELRDMIVSRFGRFSELAQAIDEEIFVITSYASAPRNALLRRMAEESLRAAEQMAQYLGPGTFWGDVLVVQNVKRDARRRQEAAQRLFERWFSRPIPKPRWRLVRPHLRRRAADEERDEGEVLREATVSAIFLAVHHVFETSEEEIGYRELRASVANLVCEDLIGPAWRRTSNGKEIPMAEEWAWPLTEEEVGAEDETARLLEILLEMKVPAAQRRALVARAEGLRTTNADDQAIHRFHRSGEAQKLQQFFVDSA